MFSPSMVLTFLVLLLSFGQVPALTISDLNRLDAVINGMTLANSLLGRHWECGYNTMMDAIQFGTNIQDGKAACIRGDRYVMSALAPIVDDFGSASLQIDDSLDDSEEAIKITPYQLLDKSQELVKGFKLMLTNVVQNACAYKLTDDSDTADVLFGANKSFETGFDGLVKDLEQIPALARQLESLRNDIESVVLELKTLFGKLADNDASQECLDIDVHNPS